jgi:hypothetical protein
MALQTNVKVRIVGTNDAPKPGVIVTISNPPLSYIGVPSNTPAPAALQTQTTDANGYVLFTALNADVYAIGVSGTKTNYVVKNTFVVNPDTIPFENRTFASSTMSGTNILTQNYVVNVGSGLGSYPAPNVIADFTGGIRTAANTQSSFLANTDTVILWSGTNSTKQFNNSYSHTTQGLAALQSTTIKINI